MAKKPAPRSKRYGSRPAFLPKEKEELKDSLLEGIDKLGELLKLKSSKSGSWKTIKGKPRSAWLALVRYRGSWDWDSLHRAWRRFSKPDAKRLINYRRLAYCSLHFEEYDRKGKVKRTGWFSAGPTTTWENLLLTLVELSSETASQSFAIRYERTVITDIVIAFGSKAVKVDWV